MQPAIEELPKWFVERAGPHADVKANEYERQDEPGDHSVA
jgi:hypothetical protein